MRRNMRITLDPGHGRMSNRGIDRTYYEGTRMFKLAYLLKSELEKYDDVTVFVTRGELDDDPTLSERGIMARENGSMLFISLHSNGADSERAHGVSLYRSVRLDGSVRLAHLLADGVTDVINSVTGITYKRGVKTRTYKENGKTYDYYGVIRNSAGGGVEYSYIIEHGFHTNEKECAFLLDDDNLLKIAQREAQIIAQYFSLKEKQSEVEYVEYTVKRGDTLSRIARSYNTDYRTLAQFNDIADPDRIYSDQVIKIPVSSDKTIRVGDLVQIKDEVNTYYPNGKSFNDWVRGYRYIIAQTVSGRGRQVYKGGDKCVLLGEKIDIKTGKREASINTWCSIKHLNKIN